MSKHLAVWLQIIVILASVGYSVTMSSRLPAVVPTHWGLNGKPDGYGSSALNLWIMPGAEVFILLLTFALPSLSPKRYEVTRFATTFSYVMFLVTLLMAILHFVIINASAGAKFDIGRMMMIVLFGFLAAIGNVLGKVKQNFYVGVRTPWTLADSRVWDHTHREAGFIILIGGLAGLVLALVGLNVVLLYGWLIFLALTPVIRSYVWYRRLVIGGGTT